MMGRYYIYTDISSCEYGGYITTYAIAHNGNKICSEGTYLSSYTGPRSRLTAICKAMQQIPSNSDVVLQTTDEYAIFAFNFKGFFKESMKNVEELKVILENKKRMRSCYVQRLKFQYLHEYCQKQCKKIKQELKKGAIINKNYGNNR